MGWSETPTSFEEFNLVGLSKGGAKEKCVVWAFLARWLGQYGLFEMIMCLITKIVDRLWLICLK
jgi:hypothetical protein